MAGDDAHSESQATADRGAGIEISDKPDELDLATGDDVVKRAAQPSIARLLLLDLAGVSFCDARGLGYHEHRGSPFLG